MGLEPSSKNMSKDLTKKTKRRRETLNETLRKQGYAADGTSLKQPVSDQNTLAPPIKLNDSPIPGQEMINS